MDNFFRMEFHFPYDKVTLEKVDGDTHQIYRDAMLMAVKPFTVQVTDWQGKVTGKVEIINPSLVTHLVIHPYTPF